MGLICVEKDNKESPFNPYTEYLYALCKKMTKYLHHSLVSHCSTFTHKLLYCTACSFFLCVCVCVFFGQIQFIRDIQLMLCSIYSERPQENAPVVSLAVILYPFRLPPSMRPLSSLTLRWAPLSSRPLRSS